MSRVAFMTFGVLHAPRTHRRSKAFLDGSPAIHEAAERSEGFVAGSNLDSDTGRDRWGQFICPGFLPEELGPHMARTLTLWESLETLFAFAYAGPHAAALGGRKEWFRKTEFPAYVVWWVADDQVPTFAEATARLERLHERGPTPEAFTFSCPFDWDGTPTAIDHTLVNEIIARNAGRTHTDEPSIHV